jgi:hypothetical protein
MSAYTLQQALAGNLFFGSSAATGVVPTTSTTAQVFGLWNPGGSLVNCLLDKLLFADAVPGTATAGALGLSILTPAGQSLGTPISAFTDGTIRNSIIGLGKAPRARFTGSAATTTATAFLMSLGWAQVAAAAAAPVSFSGSVIDFDGSVIIPQNTAIFVTVSAAIASALAMTLSWAEIPG